MPTRSSAPSVEEKPIRPPRRAELSGSLHRRVRPVEEVVGDFQDGGAEDTVASSSGLPLGSLSLGRACCVLCRDLAALGPRGSLCLGLRQHVDCISHAGWRSQMRFRVLLYLQQPAARCRVHARGPLSSAFPSLHQEGLSWSAAGVFGVRHGGVASRCWAAPPEGRRPRCLSPECPSGPREFPARSVWAEPAPARHSRLSKGGHGPLSGGCFAHKSHSCLFWWLQHGWCSA